MGLTSAARKTKAPSAETVAHLATVADGLHALLVKRADELAGCLKVLQKWQNWRRSRMRLTPTRRNGGHLEKSQVAKGSGFALV